MRRASVAAARSPRTRRRQRQEPRRGPCSWAWAAPSRPRSGPRAPRGGRRASGRISGVPHAAAEPRARALAAGGSEPHASWGELRTLDRRCRGRREVAARLLGAWRDAACRACADCVPRPVSCVLCPAARPGAVAGPEGRPQTAGEGGRSALGAASPAPPKPSEAIMLLLAVSHAGWSHRRTPWAVGLRGAVTRFYLITYRRWYSFL